MGDAQVLTEQTKGMIIMEERSAMHEAEETSAPGRRRYSPRRNRRTVIRYGDLKPSEPIGMT